MITLMIFLLNTMPITATAGLIFPENFKTREFFGNVYEANVNILPLKMSNVFFGLANSLVYKKAIPFANAYFRDTDLHTKILAFGAGPVASVNIQNILNVGMLVRLNYFKVFYPKPGANSTVVYKTENHFNPGFELFANFIPIKFGALRLGVEIGLQSLGYGEKIYYYGYESEEAYKPFDYMNFAGPVLRIIVGRW